jgi:ABC-type uncharacterized transport system substrate-binding protein
MGYIVVHFQFWMFGEAAMAKHIVGVIILALVIIPPCRNTPFAGSKPLTIAMLLWRGETEAERGFKDRLQELGYAAQYTILDAAQDPKRLGALLHRLTPQLDTFDYIYTFGTTVSRITRVVVHDRVPQIFNVVTDPVGAGIVQSMAASGGNVSGMSSKVPLRVQIRHALDIIPFRKLGLLFNPREKNSMLVRQELYDLAKAWHFELLDLRAPPAQDMLQAQLQKLADGSIRVDAVYLPPDSFLVSNALMIGSQLRMAKIRTIAAVKPFIDYGALLGMVTDYYHLGWTAAGIVDRHQKGEPLQHIPVGTVTDPQLVINNTTRHLLQLLIPESVLKKAVLVE